MLKQFTPVIIQRYNLELVVSDGGSTDRTLAIAQARMLSLKTFSE
jgi:glycosyltransferase involved in cell wall biosynthesis